MARTPIPLSNGFGVDESQLLSNQEVLNLYPAVVQSQGALSMSVLRSPSGLVEILSPFDGVGRGTIVMNNLLFVVIGENLYEIAENESFILRGVGIVGTGRVKIAENNLVLTIVVPETPDGYFYDGTTNVFELIIDPVFVDYGDKLDVTYKDGFFIYLTKREFFLSSSVIINNGKDFDGLDFSTAEISTDDNVAINVIRNELYIFGRDSIEVFQNTGNQDFPYQRIPGAAIDRGVIARDSVIPFQNSYLFIGAGKNEGISIWEGQPGQTIRVSTNPIDNILQALPVEDVRNAYAFRYSEGGNFFCGFTIPNQDTYVFDLTTTTAAQKQIWHRRSSSQDGLTPWRVSHIEQAYGKIWVLDNIDGRVGQFRQDIFTEYTDEILRRFHTEYLFNDGDRFTMSSMEMKSQVGITEPHINGIAGDITLSFSTDGGQTFKTPLNKTLPNSPSGLIRSNWKRLGLTEYSLVMRLDVITTSKLAHLALFADVEPGR